ncbi:MAG: hypothetical protein EOP06_02160 [Proteobacteria bacterium]|jgi:hypothetical protein|nr:MAG: hypothetical protein EOP06_02160 [Pseudomonadota bacterium]
MLRVLLTILIIFSAAVDSCLAVELSRQVVDVTALALNAHEDCLHVQMEKSNGEDQSLDGAGDVCKNCQTCQPWFQNGNQVFFSYQPVDLPTACDLPLLLSRSLEVSKRPPKV